MSKEDPPSSLTLQNAEIEWQDGGEPFSRQFADIYFSREGGIAETRHVFLQANDLLNRWQQAALRGDKLFTIAELGFGTGLNFLCCWQLWRQWQLSAPGQHGLRLHFISCEKYPMRQQALQESHKHWPELAEFSQSLLSQYPDHTPGYQRLHCLSSDTKDRICLDLYLGDAQQMLAESDAIVDAWFFDGFAPRVNPDMWSETLLQTVARLSKPGTTISSYSVTGRVVRYLQELGFNVEKLPGFGSKRQMMFAQLQSSYESSVIDTFSAQSASAHGKDKHVIVIGSGLAGCSTAWQLAQRGYRVSVLEQAGEIANGASGNPQGVLQCRMNRQVSREWYFNLQSFLYAARHYTQLAQQSAIDIEWHNCGVLTLDSAYANARKNPEQDAYCHYAEQVLQRHDSGSCSDISGIDIKQAGYFLPHGGWLNPGALCNAYLQHPFIELYLHSDVASIRKPNDSWQIFNADDSLIASADTVVIANSYRANALLQTIRYPLTALRGQLSFLPQSTETEQLNCVVCAESYIAPAQNNLHCIGASYVKNSTATNLSDAEHLQNISGISKHLPELGLGRNTIISGRASVRGGTLDFMPIVGMVDGSDGLFINVGHGSHGLTTTPLCAEYLSCLISKEPSPLQNDVALCLVPDRFAKRKRKKAGN